jgi:hypothetical protein
VFIGVLNPLTARNIFPHWAATMAAFGLKFVLTTFWHK